MTKQVEYFLGANSRHGFQSFYDDLFCDPRIEKVWIIKGGPGNGKSTFMRAMGAVAAERGLEQEWILCSSDPDSLDGIIIPAVKLAIVDGTAPHVVEPQVCGMDAEYLNFSACYRDGMRQDAAEILDAQQKNKARYPLVYTCLSAAGTLSQQIRQIAAQQLPDGKLEQLTQGIIHAEFQQPGQQPGVIRRFVSGITPKGLQYRLEALQDYRLYSLTDTFGLSDPLLQLLKQAALEKGYFCIAGHSPLEPERLEQLLIPQLKLAFVRTSQQLAYHGATFCQIDLDALVPLPELDKNHMPFFVCTIKALVQEGIGYLQEAKAQHDRLELLCRPYVDFSAVSALRETYAQRLHKLIDKVKKA